MEVIHHLNIYTTVRVHKMFLCKNRQWLFSVLQNVVNSAPLLFDVGVVWPNADIFGFGSGFRYFSCFLLGRVVGKVSD